MRVRMLSTAAGPAGVWPAGSIQDLSDKQALLLVGGGYAEAITIAPVPTSGPEVKQKPATETPEPPQPKVRAARGRR